MGIKVKATTILKKLSDVSLMQTVYETITNSLEAKAENITIKFLGKESTDLFESKTEISGYSITDDGEGFNIDNRNSFSEYLSEHKIDLGCKGVGRFTWLKVFEQVVINSKASTEVININFNKEFDPDIDINASEHSNKETSTEIKFTGIISKKSPTILDLDEIKRDILQHFAVKFFLLNKKGHNFKIVLTSDINDQTREISSEDILNFDKETYVMEKYPTKGIFEVYYTFVPSDKKHRGLFLCANERVIESNETEYSHLLNNESLVVVVLSRLFDDNVNEERTNFTFVKGKSQQNLFDEEPSYNEIREAISDKVDKIIINRYPEILVNNNNIIAECIAEKPHLAKYIKEDSALIKSKKSVLNNAEKMFKDDKESTRESFLKTIRKNQLDEDRLLEEISKLNELSNRELAQYFLYRQHIIDGLKKLSDDNTKLEKLLHNLFMPMNSENSDDSSTMEKYTNNIWLLDDKFMSFKSCHSDQQLSIIKNKIFENETASSTSNLMRRRPDMTIFYSNKNAVVIEFKGIGARASDKIVSISEINTNLSVVAKNFDDINVLYGYIITKFTPEFMEQIGEQPSIRTLFNSTNIPTYYLYNENIKSATGKPIPTHVYILCVDTIYSDAHERNRLFLDIIKNT